jgi:arginyl-tRNA synthetase
MATTYDTLLERLRPAFDAFVAGADPVLRPSDRCDFQANGVMAIAKQLQRPPREVAGELVRTLDIADLATVEVAGPGFLNFQLTSSFLQDQLAAVAMDDRVGVPVTQAPRTIVIDYSSPNVAKEMHVGHLRTTVIGDAVRRINEFAGHRVIARNHVGDWGTPFGMLIEHLLDLGEDAGIASLSMGDLDSFYVAAREKYEANEEFAERSRRRVVLLQAGDPATIRLWSILVEQSVHYFDEVYRKLDIKLTPLEVVGESFYNGQLDTVVTDLRALGLLVESDGAQCVFPPGFVNRDNEPLPLIVQKRDGGYGYAATDLAAIRDRVDHLGADEILYVIGTTQELHLDMVFATAAMAGWLPDHVHCEHVHFGNVLGLDRKLLRTRLGGTVKLVALLDEAVERADASLLARDTGLDADARRELATVIARAAVKYADLSTERQHDYVFDMERMVAFEGDTGPYLAYAHARIRSIFRRLDDEEFVPGTSAFALTEPAERELALGVLGFPEAVEAARTQIAPHRLCGYLFDLAQRFTAFYEACPVLTADPPVRDERLALCDLTARALALGLSLLGIGAPERM